MTSRYLVVSKRINQTKGSCGYDNLKQRCDYSVQRFVLRVLIAEITKSAQGI